jgi:hypothetical protein
LTFRKKRSFPALTAIDGLHDTRSAEVVIPYPI